MRQSLMQLKSQHIELVCYQLFYADEGQIQPLILGPANQSYAGKEVVQISLTTGEPSQVTAPWGHCHARRMRWKGHSECW